MKLTKLAKKILKEQAQEGTVHLWSGFVLSGPNSGVGNNYNNAIINQEPPNVVGSDSYKAGLIGPSDPGPQWYQTQVGGLNFSWNELVNNNNIIHNVWGSPSQGQVVKLYTCGPNVPNCQPTCMKYEGPMGAYQFDFDLLRPNGWPALLYPTQGGGSPTIIGDAGVSMGTYGYASLLNQILGGPYNSCSECDGNPPAEQGYSCRSNQVDGTSSCVPCPQNLYPDGGGVPGCPFTSLEECEATGCKEGTGKIPIDRTKPTKPTKDKMIDPVKDRMQNLANIKPTKK